MKLVVPILIGGVCLGAGAAGPGGPGPAAAAEAGLPRGTWSAGLHGAYAILDMQELESALAATPGADFEPPDRAREVAVDVRYAFRPEFFLGLEGGYLRGEAEDRAGTREPVTVSGVPLQVIGGGTVGRWDDLAVRIVVGLGVLLDGALASGGETLGSGTGFLATLGGEAEVRLAPAWALSAQAVARSAQVSAPGDLAYELDFSGASLRLGVRTYFGGGRP
jgi:hypothetical protein